MASKSAAAKRATKPDNGTMSTKAMQKCIGMNASSKQAVGVIKAGSSPKTGSSDARKNVTSNGRRTKHF